MGSPKQVSTPNPFIRAAIGDGKVPYVEKASDILSGKSTAYDHVPPEIDMVDRANMIVSTKRLRRLRGGSSNGAAPLLRRVLGTSDAEGNYPMFSADELVKIIRKSRSNIVTTLSNLRSPEYCGKGYVFVTKAKKIHGIIYYQFDPEWIQKD